MLRVVNPVSSSLGVCQPAIQKEAFSWEEKPCCWKKWSLRFQMLYTWCVCIRSSQHALISLYLYKTNCHQSLSQIFACCLNASGKAALLSDRETTGRSWLISAQHPESRIYLIAVSFQNRTDQAGIIRLSFRPGLGQPHVPMCVFSVPICNWNQGAQGSIIFRGEKLQSFPLKSLFSC